jgi:hypothetical protein
MYGRGSRDWLTLKNTGKRATVRYVHIPIPTMEPCDASMGLGGLSLVGVSSNLTVCCPNLCVEYVRCDNFTSNAAEPHGIVRREGKPAVDEMVSAEA